MKYKDTFINYYITNRFKEAFEIFLERLNYWWCCDCGKYHSPRVKMYQKTRLHKGFQMWDGNTCNEIHE
jgi:hypothetical protein